MAAAAHRREHGGVRLVRAEGLRAGKVCARGPSPCTVHSRGVASWLRGLPVMSPWALGLVNADSGAKLVGDERRRWRLGEVRGK